MPQGIRKQKPAKNRFAGMRFPQGARTPIHLIEKAMTELLQSTAAKKIILDELKGRDPATLQAEQLLTITQKALKAAIAEIEGQ